MSLSMLHLMLVGGDLACASHGASAAAPPTMAMAMAGMTSHADAHADSHAKSRAHAPPATDCATPAQSRCCDAMSSCGVTTKVSTTSRLNALPVPVAGTPAYAASTPRSVLTAPEPPPPKA